MERETIFAIREGVNTIYYQTNAPYSLVGSLFGYDISRIEFLDRITKVGYEVKRLEADLYFSFNNQSI